MPVLIHTNLSHSIEVEQVEGSHEGVVLKPFKPKGLQYPVIVGPTASGWPLFCVNVSVEESSSFLVLSVPTLDHKGRLIDVHLDGLPQSGGSEFWLSSTSYFSIGTVSVTFSKKTIVVLRVDPTFGRRSQEAIQILAMLEPNGTLRLASHCAMHLPNRSALEDEVHSDRAFLRVAWRHGERPQVWIRPDMLPEPAGQNRNAGALVATIPASPGEALAICYAEKARWLSEVIRINREVDKPEELRRGRTS